MLNVLQEGFTTILEIDSNAANTVSPELCKKIEAQLSVLEKARDKKCVIVTGKGSFFSNGFEPTCFVGKTDAEIEELLSRAFHLSLRFYKLPQITICAMNGHAMGAGAIWAINMNYRISVPKMRFGFPEILIGLSIPSAPAYMLEKLTNSVKMRDLTYEGIGIKPAQALEMGVIDEIAEDDKLLDVARRTAKRFANTPFDVIVATQQATKTPYYEMLERLTENDIKMGVQMIKSPNGQEGLKSILEKRRPVFS